MYKAGLQGPVLCPGLPGIAYGRVAFKPLDVPGWLAGGHPVPRFAGYCRVLYTAGLSHQMNQAGLSIYEREAAS